MILISDGEPTDSGWEKVAERCRAAEAERKAVIYPIGTQGADLIKLGRFSHRDAKKLKGLEFGELFVWLSRSMTVVSTSAPGDKVRIPDTSWVDVEV